MKEYNEEYNNMSQKERETPLGNVLVVCYFIWWIIFCSVRYNELKHLLLVFIAPTLVVKWVNKSKTTKL